MEQKTEQILVKENNELPIKLSDAYEGCMWACYTTVENDGTFCIKDWFDDVAEVNNLYIYLQWSNGKIDWKNNFDFPAKPYRDMENKWFCHRGFLKVWKSIEPYVKDKIMNNKYKNIYIIGYSHGGAIAQLCYEYVKFNRPDVNVVGYGFGSPRVLWGHVNKTVKERFKDFVIIRNNNDIVTHLPPVIFGFHNVCKVLNLNKTKSKGLVKDHYITSYEESIAKYEEQELKRL